MKKLVILLSLMVFACSSDDNDRENQNNEPKEDTLLGTWKLIELEVLMTSSDQTFWQPVPDWFSHTYSFNADFTVTRTGYDCDGTYENSPTDYIEITFECPGNSDYREFNISFDNHNLILTPPGSCDESGACASKYEKIIND